MLIKIAWAQANLEEKEVELFHQDSLEPLLISPADVAVCSLPVGFYPNDERAKDYELKAKKVIPLRIIYSLSKVFVTRKKAASYSSSFQTICLKEKKAYN